MFASTVADAALVITALGVFAVSVAGAVATVIAALAQSRREAELLSRVDEVHAEVKTINGMTLGAMADAGETRRVDAIPTGERTGAEAQHVAKVDDKGEAVLEAGPEADSAAARDADRQDP